jgi:hypothetical protein
VSTRPGRDRDALRRHVLAQVERHAVALLASLAQSSAARPLADCRTHALGDCYDATRCAVHRPSAHHMVSWPQVWRPDRRIVERRCEHGIGHPDPDDLRLVSGWDDGVHGCDGCCVPPATPRAGTKLLASLEPEAATEEGKDR